MAWMYNEEFNYPPGNLLQDVSNWYVRAGTTGHINTGNNYINPRLVLGAAEVMFGCDNVAVHTIDPDANGISIQWQVTPNISHQNDGFVCYFLPVATGGMIGSPVLTWNNGLYGGSGGEATISYISTIGWFPIIISSIFNRNSSNVIYAELNRQDRVYQKLVVNGVDLTSQCTAQLLIGTQHIQTIRFESRYGHGVSGSVYPTIDYFRCSELPSGTISRRQLFTGGLSHRAMR